MRHLIFFLAAVVCLNHNISGQEIPLSVETQLEIATAHAKESRFAEAATAVTSAIALEPKNVDLYLRRANYHRLAKNLNGVRADIDRAWTLSHNSENVLILASRLLDTGETVDCRGMHTMADTFINANSQNDVGYEARFRARTCLDDMSGAFNDISMAVELAPENMTHRMNRANILSRLGDSNQALDAYQQMIGSLEKNIAAELLPQKVKDLKRELAFIHTGRSKLFERKGDHVSALADWSRAIELMPNETFYHQRAMYYQRLKRFDEAIADYTRAIEIEKKDFYIYLIGRAGVQASAGNYRAAIADYEDGLKHRPEERHRIEPLLESVRKLLANQK